MDFNNYIVWTETTAVYSPENARHYLNAGLISEVGELLGKIAKLFRGDKSYDTLKDDLLAELGDIMWFTARHYATFTNYTTIELHKPHSDEVYDPYTGKLLNYSYDPVPKKFLFDAAMSILDCATDLVDVIIYYGEDSEDLVPLYRNLIVSCVRFAHLNGVSLKEVVDKNVAKLSSRLERGTLKGDGDNR